MLGLPPPAVLKVDLEIASARDAVRSWIGRRPPVTAVCAYNDETAFALLAAADGLGVVVPGVLAVIGVEDIRTAAFAHPPLTTISLDNQQHARFVVTSLLARLRGVEQPEASSAVDHRIVVRVSA